MSLLQESFDAKKFDVRVVERNVLRGVISAEDAKKATEKLPDDAANGDMVTWKDITNQDSRSG